MPTAPTTLDLGIRFEIRGSLGGGVASARCEGDCDQPTEILRNALAMPASPQKGHPLLAKRAGRQRQPNLATPNSAVGDLRRAMASKMNQVAVGGRSSKGLDKKPIRVE